MRIPVQRLVQTLVLEGPLPPPPPLIMLYFTATVLENQLPFSCSYPEENSLTALVTVVRGLWRQLNKQFRSGSYVTLKHIPLGSDLFVWVGFFLAVQILVAVEVTTVEYFMPPSLWTETSVLVQCNAGFFTRMLFRTGSFMILSPELSVITTENWGACTSEL